MRKYSNEEVIHEAQVFLETPGGVLAVAKLLQIPKSTVHWHVSERLKWIDLELWRKVRKTISYNKHNKGRKRR